MKKNNITRNGITAYTTELENGNVKVEIEGMEGNKQFTDKKEAEKFIDNQFEKACA